MTALLQVAHLRKSYGALCVTNDVSLDVRMGEIHALIGPNGAGKTSLIAQLSGAVAPDAGRILFEGRDITRWPPHERARAGVARSYQITSVYPEMTALDQTLLAVEGLDGGPWRFVAPSRRHARLVEQAQAALDAVGLGARAHDLAASLSHGEKRQLELALALVGGARLLLLDEPAAGMSLEETRALDARLAALRAGHGILLVEHDMDLVFGLADRITVLHEGRVIASGAPDAIRRDRAVRDAYLGEALP